MGQPRTVEQSLNPVKRPGVKAKYRKYTVRKPLLGNIFRPIDWTGTVVVTLTLGDEIGATAEAATPDDLLGALGISEEKREAALGLLKMLSD